MKLLFLFMRYGSITPWSENWKNNKTNAYPDFKNSCYLKLIEGLVESKISNVEGATILIEDGSKCGEANWSNSEKISCFVLPHIEAASEFIDEDTIIFVRGGFKHWHEWIMKYKNKNWIVLYAANTGMERWPNWDIILDDLNMYLKIDEHKRIFYPFIKPVNEEKFFLKNEIQEPSFDLCVGASHIHDKKGQWRVRHVFNSYKKLFGEELKVIMPGSPRRSIETNAMYTDMNYVSKIYIPGFVNEKELNGIFNETKYFIHLGAHGQNDRGPLEAAASGLPLLIGSKKYHTKLLQPISHFSEDINIDDYDCIAKQINLLLSMYKPNIKRHIYNYYLKNLSFRKSLENMIVLFRSIGLTGEPRIQKIREKLFTYLKYML